MDSPRPACGRHGPTIGAVAGLAAATDRDPMDSQGGLDPIRTGRDAQRAGASRLLRRLWLVFAQATTAGLALLFVVATLKPQWLERPPGAARGEAAGRVAAMAPASPGLAIRQVPAGDAAGRANALGSYADAAMQAMPAVVNVYTTKQIRRSGPDELAARELFGQGSEADPQQVTLGSGVIATADGYVLTNNHVVQAADAIAVALSDGRRVGARLVGSDPETDLALLKVELPQLPTMTFGHSETLKVGDVVLAIGNPFDIGQTVTMGIVSALGRTNIGLNTFENFIQTDAAINEGNSGGALVDSNGHLVGINTAMFARSGGSVGIGFAIPTSTITQVMEQLIRYGHMRRGYFGLELADLTPELAEALRMQHAEGVVVRGVLRNAPAGRAGLEPGDVVVAIDGGAVRDRRATLSRIAQLEPGATATVRLLREGRTLELPIAVGERPAPAVAR